MNDAFDNSHDDLWILNLIKKQTDASLKCNKVSIEEKVEVSHETKGEEKN